MDFHNLKNDWETFKILTNDIEQDIFVFFKKPDSRKQCTFIRKKSKSIEKLGKKIKKNIIKQRQDYKSDYS